jgi:MFS family permease
VAVLGWLGLASPWHIVATATVAGIVWSTENATRRRMVGECVPPVLVSRALALDTMSNSVTRLIGPLTAGALYQHYGLGGCFTASAVVYALSTWLAFGLKYRQETHRFVVAHVPRDLMEGLRYVRGDVVIGGVLAITVVMNLLGFPYSALVAPIGRTIFHVSPALIGVLAAAEAFGAALGGLWLTTKEPRISGRILMVGGSVLYLACVFSMPQMPLFWLAFGVLALGGFGSAAFSNMQTALIVLNTPAHIRSRLMGLLTVCIGMGPLGILLVGTIANFLGPREAIDLVASAGFVLASIIGEVWRRREMGQDAAQTS